MENSLRKVAKEQGKGSTHVLGVPKLTLFYKLFGKFPNPLR